MNANIIELLTLAQLSQDKTGGASSVTNPAGEYIDLDYAAAKVCCSLTGRRRGLGRA